jgi:hypothetical protein
MIGAYMRGGFLVEDDLEQMRGEDGRAAVMEAKARLGMAWGDFLCICPWGRATSTCNNTMLMLTIFSK